MNAYYTYSKRVKIADERILACCMQIKPHVRKVIMLTNDIALRSYTRFSRIEVCMKENISKRLDELSFNRTQKHVEQMFAEVSTANRREKLMALLRESNLIGTIVLVESTEKAIDLTAFLCDSNVDNILIGHNGVQQQSNSNECVVKQFETGIRKVIIASISVYHLCGTSQYNQLISITHILTFIHFFRFQKCATYH